VADEDTLRLEGREHVRRLEPQQQVDAERCLSAGVEAVRADGIGDDQRAGRRPPQRRLAPVLPARRGAGRRSGQREPHSRGCGGRGAGSRRPARRERAPGRSPQASPAGRRARPCRRRRERATFASPPRPRPSRTRSARGRRRIGTSRLLDRSESLAKPVRGHRLELLGPDDEQVEESHPAVVGHASSASRWSTLSRRRMTRASPSRASTAAGRLTPL